MIINRAAGERMKIDMLPVGRQKNQTHFLLEVDLNIAWKKINLSSDPRYQDPVFTEDGLNKWAIFSGLTGEKLAEVSLLKPAAGRRSP